MYIIRIFWARLLSGLTLSFVFGLARSLFFSRSRIESSIFFILKNLTVNMLCDGKCLLCVCL